MRVGSNNLEFVKQKIYSLQGKSVKFVINKGRNKYISINALVDKVYPSMFVIKPEKTIDFCRTSFSYFDILCGEIKLAES